MIVIVVAVAVVAVATRLDRTDTGMLATAAGAALPQGAAELRPEDYRDAVLFTAAGTDVSAGPLAWASGVASDSRVWAYDVVALGGDDFLVAQPVAPAGRRYARIDGNGRVSVPKRSRRWPHDVNDSLKPDLAVTPDGRILLATDSAVWWVATDGQTSLLMRAIPTIDKAANVEGIAGVAVLPGGDAIVADRASRQIVRIGPGGSRTVVAGNGAALRSGDGGPAVKAGIGELGPIATFPDGSVLLAQDLTAGDPTYVVRRVDSEGQITTLAGGGRRATDKDCLSKPVPAKSVAFHDIVDLLALPAGDFLLSDRRAGVFHVSGSGQLTPMLCQDSPEPTDRFDTNIDGRRASTIALATPGSLALTSDGTLLVSESGNGTFLAMLAPVGGGRRLAVAIAPETHATITRRRLVIAATHPAAVAIRVAHGRKTVITTRTTVPAGRSTLSLPGRVPAGDIDVFVSANADGRLAADRLKTIVPGRRGLPIAPVRRLILRAVALTVQDPKITGCKAISRSAVRCRLRDVADDYERDDQWTIHRTKDGLLHATVRDTLAGGAETERYVIQP